MVFTTMGITAIHLLLASEEQLKRFYSLMRGLSSRDVDTLLHTLTENRDAINELRTEIRTDTPEYSRLVEDVKDFKKTFLFASDVEKVSIDDMFDDFLGVDLTSEFIEEKQEQEPIKANTEVLDELSIFLNEDWRQSIKKSEDISIIENHFDALQERYSQLSKRFIGDVSSDLWLREMELKIIAELQKNLYKTDSILAEIYKNSGRESEVLNVPIYSNYYYSRKNIYKQVSSTYEQAQPQKIDIAVKEINTFLKGTKIDISSTFHEDLEGALEKYCTYDSKGNKSSTMIKGNDIVMTVLNEFYVLLMELEDNVNKTFFGDKIYEDDELTRLAVDLAERYKIIGYLPEAVSVLVKSVYCIYKHRTERRALEPREMRVFYFVKMALISFKYGFRR